MQDHQVHQRNGKQEKRRHQRADHPADLFETGHLSLHGHRCDGNANRREHDNRGMAEGEHQADGDRPFADLHQFAGHVVDRRDVVSIDRMSKPEACRRAGWCP